MDEVVGVIMRVPGLFILDFWWENIVSKGVYLSLESSQTPEFYKKNLVLVYGLLLLCLPLRYVQAMYSHLICAILLFCCRILSLSCVGMVNPIKTELDVTTSYNLIAKSVGMLVFHLASGALISRMLDVSVHVVSVYALPLAAIFLGLSPCAVASLQKLCDVVTFLSIFLYAGRRIMALLKTKWWPLNYPHHLAPLLWERLCVPSHFALYWIIKFLVLLPGHSNEWYLMALATASDMCANPVRLVATSVSVSYLSFFALCCTRAYLQGIWSGVPSGWTEGIIFTCLSMQTGLMELKPSARTAVLTLILFTVLSSLLDSVLELAEPVVLALAVSRGTSPYRHARALILCLFILVFPVYLSSLLLGRLPLNFWLVIILSNSILTSVQVLNILVVHCLFMYDSNRSEPWDKLDEVVYYTRATSKVLEFLVALLAVAVGMWDYSVGKWSVMSASILLVHCYFNVGQRLLGGWRSFVQRREASKKSEAFASATEDQLQQLDDVCSICYSEMTSACVTPCKHFFHRACLRKWLYVQNNCPLCHDVLS